MAIPQDFDGMQSRRYTVQAVATRVDIGVLRDVPSGNRATVPDAE